MTVTAEDILTEAINILSEPGAWQQKSYCNGTAPLLPDALSESTAFCTVGAIAEARRRLNYGGSLLSPNDAWSAFNRALFLSGYTQSAVTWNDDSRRQQSEVVAMMEKAKAYAAEYKY